MRETIRRALTKERLVTKGQRRKLEFEEVPPSERVVLLVQFTMVAVGALTVLELAHLTVLGEWSSEVFAAITGLIGTITGVFIGNRT